MPLNTVPLNTVSLNTVPLNTVPLNTVLLNTVPLNTVPLNTVPLNTVPLITGSNVFFWPRTVKKCTYCFMTLLSSLCLLSQLPNWLIHEDYINDLPSCIQFSNIMMYAEDTVVYLSSPSTSEIELKLNLDLANLSQWLHYN